MHHFIRANSPITAFGIAEQQNFAREFSFQTFPSATPAPLQKNLQFP
jgi:hypothetical protein